MKKSPLATNAPDNNSRANLSAARVMLDFVDTAWRIAIPVVLFAGVGIFFDKKIGSEPWLTLLGCAFGFVVAGLLVKQLLVGVKIVSPKETKDA